jgi:tRNA dimethylallyltransferase
MPGELILIAGPTAVGKSEIALHLAEQLGGEIISVDSMQVYRGMDIGTAKPTVADRRRVKHHLVDIVEPTEPFDAAQFARHAAAAVQETQARGAMPILCGGTGLYFKAFLEGLGEAPPASAELRATLQKIPPAELLQELEARDPATFHRIDRKNLRRVIRAIEVIRLTGKPFSQQRAQWKAPEAADYRPSSIGIIRDREELRARIDIRVEEMFRRGLVAETKDLLRKGLASNKVAAQALGYRQVIDHLEGRLSLKQAIELVKVRTRQFAKRQLTWFRRQFVLQWITVPSGEEADQTAVRVNQSLSNR